MRILIPLAGLASVAALTLAVELCLGATPGAARPGADHLPLWALFSFAVSAFRDPLR